MVTQEPSDHTTGRLDHPNPEEVEENGFKLSFMKMLETFRENEKLPLRNRGKDKQKLGTKKPKESKKKQLNR